MGGMRLQLWMEFWCQVDSAQNMVDWNHADVAGWFIAFITPISDLAMHTYIFL